jgi:DNA-binding transcriptional LysR family regulator
MMQNLYDDLNLFCAVVNAGSFYKAAKFLNLPHSTVSRRIANLEQHLDEKLIERTTRKMRVTDKGEQMFVRCQPLFQQLNVAISESLDDECELKGQMKITMPTRVGLDYMGEFLIAFNKLHPGLELDIQISNDLSDLVAENIDLAFRVGPLVDSSSIAVKLWDVPFHLVAHQDTIKKFEISTENFELRRLSELPCVIAYPQNKWLFEDNKQGQITITPKTGLRVNDLSIALHGAMQTSHVAYVPEIIIQNMQHFPELTIIRGQGWKTQKRTMYAFYTASRRSSQKVKAVIEYVKKAYAERYSLAD